MYWAAVNNRPSLFRFILEKGAVGIQVEKDQILQVAAASGNVEVVATLLDVGAMDVNALKTSPLVLASKHGHPNVVRILMTHRCYNISEWRTALNGAACSGHVSVAQVLLEIGKATFSKHEAMAASVVALNLACTKNQFDVARFLVENIAVDYANAPAQLISAAAGRGVKRLVSFLLDNGVNVDSHDGKPLLQAAQGGHLNIIDLLLERGANVNVDGRGARALLAAVSGDHSSVVKRLLDLNIASDPPLLNEALRLAAKSESPELCTILMDRGANPNSLGYLALFNALEGRNASVVELLLAVVAAQFFTSRCFSMALSEVEGFPGLVQRLENSRQNAQSRTDTDESS